MRFLPKYVYVGLLACAIVACGGGGGGSESGAPAPTPQPSQAPSPEPSPTPSQTPSPEPSSEPSPQPSTEPSPEPSTDPAPTPTPVPSVEPSPTPVDAVPTVTITYPRQTAKTTTGTIAIRGTASDDKGVSGVFVNGVEAQLIPRSNEASSKASAGALGKSSEDDNTVEWEATVELDQGSTHIEVEVVDSGDQRTPAEREVKYYKLPDHVVWDKANDQYVGWSDFNTLTRIDAEDESISSVTNEAYKRNGAAVLHKDGNTMILPEVRENKFVLYSQNLETALLHNLGSLDIELTFDESSFASVTTTTYDFDNDVFYFLVRYYAANMLDYRSLIYSYDFAEATLSLLVDGEPLDDTYLQLADIYFANDRLYGVETRFYAYKEAIYEIDVTDGEWQRTQIESGVLASVLAVSPDGQIAYLVGYEGIATVRLEDMEVSPLSLESEEPLYNLSQIRDVFLDTQRGELVISDDGVKEVVLVDVAEGTRRFLIENNQIGSGKKIRVPRAMVLNSEESYMYVLDDAGNADGFLLRVDLSTGDRHVIAQMSEQYNYLAKGIALDEENGMLYYAFSEHVFSYDLTAEETTLIMSDVVGTGPILSNVSTLSPLPESNSLLVTNSSYINGGVYKIDLETGARSHFVDLDQVEGLDIGGIVGANFDEQTQELYLYAQLQGAVYAIHVETLAWRVVVDTCLDRFLNDQLVEENGTGMDFHAGQRTLLLGGDTAVLQYNLEAQTCRVLGSSGYLDMKYLNDGSIIVSDWNALKQLHPETGEEVIISE